MLDCAAAAARGAHGRELADHVVELARRQAEESEEGTIAPLAAAEVGPRARADEVALQQRHARRVQLLLRRPEQDPQHAALRHGPRKRAVAARRDRALVQVDGRLEELDASSIRRRADVGDRLPVAERSDDTVPRLLVLVGDLRT
jgi:hypothetical protein